jgi:putative transposase
MPRQPRYFVPGLPQHVIQRGVNRQAVFFQPSDYELYRESLLNAACECDCRIHAYVLMTNHTHLLITPGHARALPLLMQAMGRTYVQKLNKQYARTGTLWQGRYKASLVQDERYLLTCQRYIELNPVRAGIVRAPGAYPWSSYRHNAAGQSDPLITPHAVYNSLDRDPQRRQAFYRTLFADSLRPATLTWIRDTTNACRVLGNNKFKDQVEKMLGHSVRPGKNGRPRKADTETRSG